MNEQRFTVTIRVGEEVPMEISASDIQEAIAGGNISCEDIHEFVDVQRITRVRRSQPHHKTIHYNIEDVA